MNNRDRYQSARFTVSTYYEDLERYHRSERWHGPIIGICAVLGFLTFIVY